MQSTNKYYFLLYATPVRVPDVSPVHCYIADPVFKLKKTASRPFFHFSHRNNYRSVSGILIRVARS